MTMDKIKIQKQVIGLGIAVSILASCAIREKPIAGERLDIRGLSVETAEPGEDAIEAPTPVAPALAFDAQQANSAWTHRNGGPEHLIDHPQLGQTLSRVWSQNIGSGNSRKNSISSDPVIANGMVYVMDAYSSVSSFSVGGASGWSKDLTPPIEGQKEVSGGGLALSEGTLVATTGHGEVIAMSAETGAEMWRHKLSGAISAAPVIVGNTVVAVGRNNSAVGLSLQNGRLKWVQNSSGSEAGIAGAGAPAASGGLVVIPFSSGEIIGAVSSNGLRAWSAAVTGGNKGIARGFVGDISGDPVVDGQTVYVANQAGRLASLDRRSGSHNWTVNDGSFTPVWPAGGSVFMISDSFEVKRLDAADGQEIWSAPLPDFKEKKARRHRATYAYFGPVVAGGQVWVAGSDGLLRNYNPEDGSLMGTVDIPGGAASQPAIAGGKLFILSANGQLHAFQ